VITDALQLAVLNRFAEELAEAGTLQFDHLAERAEGCYCTDLGECMRQLVDYERAVRVMALR
jgi:hypothetical protein